MDRKVLLNADFDTKEVLSFLHCPMCHAVLHPPFHLCKNGHGLCADCYKKLVTPKNSCSCPICRKLKPQFAFSCGVLQGVKCKYSVYGCREVLFGVQLKVHTKKCPYRVR